MKFNINEIFYSLQGESTTMGIPTVFVRFTGCNLRCDYCDTEYSYYEGNTKNLDELLNEVLKYPTDYICLTGGEPLLQKNLLFLIERLIEQKKQISIETSGSLSIEEISKKNLSNLKIIMDIKTPSSFMEDKNYYKNIDYLKPHDEVKFVCADKKDFDFSVNIIKKFELNKKSHILFSPVSDKIGYQDLALMVLNSNLKNVRMQIQLHKIIWPNTEKGV